MTESFRECANGAAFTNESRSINSLHFGIQIHAVNYFLTKHNILQRWASRPCYTVETASVILGHGGFLSKLNWSFLNFFDTNEEETSLQKIATARPQTEPRSKLKIFKRSSLHLLWHYCLMKKFWYHYWSHKGKYIQMWGPIRTCKLKIEKAGSNQCFELWYSHMDA